jgi:hypothetical protein
MLKFQYANKYPTINSLFSRISVKNFKLIASPFWSAEIYGFGRQISKYGFFPYFLPLCIYTDHSPAIWSIPTKTKHFLESKADFFFFHSPKNTLLWNRSGRPQKAFCLYSPFIFYKKINNIKKSLKTSGTIVFPAHSSPSIENRQNTQKYIDQLKKLPNCYFPIKVCMHMHDINKNSHLIYLENNIEVLTAGHTSDQRFIDRFYKIIKGFKYATSNVGGAYIYYCIELGIPFFIYGSKPRYLNKKDLNLRKGIYDPLKTAEGNKIYKMFHVLQPPKSGIKILSKNKKYILGELGLFEGISRIKMAKILYLSFFKWIIKPSSLIYTAKNNFLIKLVELIIKFYFK